MNEELLKQARDIFNENKYKDYMPYIDVYPTQDILDAYSKICISSMSSVIRLEELTVYVIYFNLYVLNVEKLMPFKKIINAYIYEQEIYSRIDTLIEIESESEVKKSKKAISFKEKFMRFNRYITFKQVHSSKNPYVYIFRYILNKGLHLDSDYNWIYRSKKFQVLNKYNKVENIYIFNSIFYLLELHVEFGGSISHIYINSMRNLHFNRKVVYKGTNSFIIKYLDEVSNELNLSTRLGNIIYKSVQKKTINIHRISQYLYDNYLDVTDKNSKYKYFIMYYYMYKIDTDGTLPVSIPSIHLNTGIRLNTNEIKIIRSILSGYHFGFIDENFSLYRQRVYDQNFNIEPKSKCFMCSYYRNDIIVNECCERLICKMCSLSSYLESNVEQCIICGTNFTKFAEIKYLYPVNTYIFQSSCREIFQYKQYYSDILSKVILNNENEYQELARVLNREDINLKQCISMYENADYSLFTISNTYLKSKLLLKIYSIKIYNIIGIFESVYQICNVVYCESCNVMITCGIRCITCKVCERTESVRRLKLSTSLYRSMVVCKKCKDVVFNIDYVNRCTSCIENLKKYKKFLIPNILFRYTELDFCPKMKMIDYFIYSLYTYTTYEAFNCSCGVFGVLT